jgi:hypothetical protein
MIIRLRSPILSMIVAHYHQDRRATPYGRNLRLPVATGISESAAGYIFKRKPTVK